MRWKVRKPGAKTRAKHMWHKWFAWYPVRVPTKGRLSGQTMVWLEPVSRKGELNCCFEDMFWDWEYRLMEPTAEEENE